MLDGPDENATDEVTVLLDGDCWVVTGEIDMETIDQFDAALRTTLDRDCGAILDMSSVTFMDSTGLSVLLRLRNEGHAITVRHPSARVRTLLETTGTAELFHVG